MSAMWAYERKSMIPITVPSQAQKVAYTAKWRVVLPMPVYTQLMTYVGGFDKECSGAGLVSLEIKDNEHIFTMYEAFLPEKQKNTGSTTDIEADEVGRLITRLAREGKKTEDLRCHWHSHNTMSVFHSSTDEDNYKVLKTGEYLVSLVLNKAGEIKASVHYYKPFTLTAENIPVTVMLDEVEVKAEWAEDIKKVQEYDKPAARPLDKWQDTGYKGTDHRQYGGGWKDWEKERDAHRERSLEALNDYLVCMADVYHQLGVPYSRWEEAECLVVDMLTNKVLRISMDVEEERDATPDDLDGSLDTPTTERHDYGAC